IRGRDGVKFVEVDARGSEVSGAKTPGFLHLKNQPEVPGHNLVLTIDKDLQEAAYNAMKRNDWIGNRIGGVVALRSNGEVLAMVSSPSYNPNQFSSGISKALWQELVNGAFQPLRNKVIQDPYAPGSTFKPLVALAALQEGIITASTLIYAPSALRFGKRIYHDHSRAGYGHINVLTALERSSNVFFYKMGISLGIDNIAKYAYSLGLGHPTGIRLPNENPGTLPTEKWKLKRFGEPWQPGENLSNAIGQGFVEATLLQMAVAFNAIGTEGKVYRPLLVKRIISHENKLIKEMSPQLITDLSRPPNQEDSEHVFIEKTHFKTVKKGLERVVNGEHGTAKWWRFKKIKMAGKTGTSQVRSFSAEDIYKRCRLRPFKDRHHGSFVGFAPADKPEITVAALALHSCSGSGGAAPIVHDVIKAYFKKYHPELKIK
ncbi:MAG: penicillin-binding protein 2, partial [Bdellovibrio sp.]